MLLELEPVLLELEPDTMLPTSLLIEAIVAANGAVSFVPVSASWSCWTVTPSPVTVASSMATVASTGVAELVFVSSWVWYNFSALVTASSSAVIVAWSLSWVVWAVFWAVVMASSSFVTVPCWVVTLSSAVVTSDSSVVTGPRPT